MPFGAGKEQWTESAEEQEKAQDKAAATKKTDKPKDKPKPLPTPSNEGQKSLLSEAGQTTLERLLAKVQAQQVVEPYSEHVPMDPAYSKYLQEQEKYLSGDYEEQLRRQMADQIMQSQQLEGQIGQTTQAMGSRGMGRVAQLQRASELDLLGQLTLAQGEASKQARTAGLQASQEMREIMRQNLESQAAIHGWEDDDLTHQQNMADGFIQAQQNLLGLMIEAGRLGDDDNAWEQFGAWSSKAWKEWSEATTTEEKANITAKYFSEGAGWDIREGPEDTGEAEYTMIQGSSGWPQYWVTMADGTQKQITKEEYDARTGG